jgi:acyl-CoA dehydrogenase
MMIPLSGLSAEQESLREIAYRFAADKIRPAAAGLDERAEFPRELIREGHSLGLINVTLPIECGGSGLSIFDACLVIEEIAWGCSGFATSMVANDLALTPIRIGGTEEQKRRFIEPIASKGELASFCLTEPGAGSDAAGLQTTVEDGGDCWIINGSKQWITNAGHASQYTVFATIDKAKKHKGICCIAVPRSTPGISVGHHENKMGQRCSDTCRVTFDNVRVPKDHMIGDVGAGFMIAMKTLDASRPMTAAIAVGIARAACEHALGYAKERKQFGVSISTFQGIQFMLADMATGVDAARLLTWRSAWLLDQGKSASIESSMAKRVSADTAMSVTTDAVQIFGGYGYTKEYPVEKLMRDAKLLQIYEGTSQIQRVVIARELLKK